ncbi:MAG: hypothetical protein KGJ66_15100 [Alphaproteobacteria bacterium]|nr:hypothetical protein [Alphaproteobacteria bacterium]
MAEAPTATLPDFWLSSGFHLLRRDPTGHLAVTDDFLRAYLERPEMRLVDESDAGERTLHAKLHAAPRAAVAATELAAIVDADIRANYGVFLDFRDRLLAAGTLEAVYLALFRTQAVTMPALLLDHLVHAILRNILADCDDPIALRAAELLFRTQKVTVADGAVMLADEETVEITARTGGLGSLGRLLLESATPTTQITLDVLSAENAATYWDRSDRFDTVLDLSFTRPGLDALCRVFERWVGHFLGVALRIEPVSQIRDERWSWHIGLDAESTAILNALYRGEPVDEARLSLLIALFRATFADTADMRPDLAGKPIYLGLAIDNARRLRLKPQNLLLNLPLARET